MFKEQVMFTKMVRISILLGLVAVTPLAQAQFAVVDVGAITQLIEQVRTLESELAVARAHLAQAQTAFASITGTRGMERLLTGAPRNYLPTDWASLQSLMQGAAGNYGPLSNNVVGNVGANAVLSPQQLASLPVTARQQIGAVRSLNALYQSLTREALATTSGRFDSLQQLIGAIPAATDQKAILELQARIGAESTLLQNEQTKLQTLYQVVLAEQRASQQGAREQALAGHGSFATRFRPAP
jgi:type IV secretion system protein VirB5